MRQSGEAFHGRSHDEAVWGSLPQENDEDVWGSLPRETS